jgi:hypothetical protein
VKETVYWDPIHCVEDSATGQSLGYRLMAERMADELAIAWGLRRKLGSSA